MLWAWLAGQPPALHLQGWEWHPTGQGAFGEQLQENGTGVHKRSNSGGRAQSWTVWKCGGNGGPREAGIAR